MKIDKSVKNKKRPSSAKSVENNAELLHVTENILKLGEKFVSTVQSIRDAVKTENNRDKKVFQKTKQRTIGELKRTIDMLTDGLVAASDKLQKIQEIDDEEKPDELETVEEREKPAKNRVESPTANGDIANLAETNVKMRKNRRKSCEIRKDDDDDDGKTERNRSNSPKNGEKIDGVDERKTKRNHSNSPKNSEKIDDDHERRKTLAGLGILSDDDENCEENSGEKRNLDEIKNIFSNRATIDDENETNENVSTKNKTPKNHKFVEKVIQDSDVSSSSLEDTDDEMDRLFGAKRKRGSSGDGTKKTRKNPTNEELNFNSELEKQLKSMKQFRLNIFYMEKAENSSKNTSNKEQSKNSSSSDNSEDDASTMEEENPGPSSKIAMDLASNEPDERERCLSALDIDKNSEADESQSDDEKNEKDDLKPTSKTNGQKLRKLADNDIVKLDDADDEINSSKKRTKNSAVVEKLLKAKVTLDSDDDYDESKPNKLKLKRKFIQSTKKKTSKILSSDDETSDKEDEDEDAKISSDEEESEKGDDDFDESANDDDDFVDDKPSTSRRRQTRQTAKKSKLTAPKRKKRGRKRVAVSTDDDEKEEDGETNTPSKGRKTIHKIMGKDDLNPETVDAYEAEKERKKRIAEKQHLYNEVIMEDDPSSPSKCPKYKKLVLEKNPDTGEILVEVNPGLVEKLKPHQISGVQFLYENSIESVAKSSNPGHGCILAHCMGLGKTLQVVAFLHTILTNKHLKMHSALVIAPLNVVLNWQHEFEKWLEDELAIDVFEMASIKDQADRAKLCDTWREDGGVLIISYNLFLNLTSDNKNKVKKEKWRKSFQEAFLDPGPDVVVCDEGHMLKNEKTGINKAVNKIRTKRRICLTGTPLQNNLTEYYTMVQFVKPNLLGTKSEFANRFANPIRNGQYIDSTPHDVSLMKRRAHILHKTLDGCLNRQDYTALAQALPPKYEYVVLINLSKLQTDLYAKYLNEVVGGSDDVQVLKNRNQLFADYQVFQRIWTNPYGLIMHQREMERKEVLKEDDDFVVEEEESELSSSSSDDEPKKKKKKSNENEDENGDSDIEVIRQYSTRRNPLEGELIPDRIPTPIEARGWFKDMVKESDKYEAENAGKFVVFFEILRKCEAIGDKLLVFSQSLIALDLIEGFLEFYENKGWSAHPDSLANLYKWGWIKNKDYFRLDGSTTADKRKSYAKQFNDSSNFRARLFLISTRAGSLGMNLFGANRVIVFDASWNPTHDVQSMFRVYRFGQTKPVYIYRFIAQGTMEETIYERGVTKQSLSCRVVDEYQIGRHFSDRDLQALYEFTPSVARTDKDIPKGDLPKDRLLADIVSDHKMWVFNHFIHDSLLKNVVEEELTEDERRAAWEDYERERKNPRYFVTTTNAALLVPDDILQVYTRAMPLLNVLILEGNDIITKCGQGQYNLQDVARAWIQNDPAVKSNPAVIIKKMQDLIINLRRAAVSQLTANANAATLASVGLQQGQSVQIFPPFPVAMNTMNNVDTPTFTRSHK